MTTILSKLLLWLKGQAVSFVLILGVLSGLAWYNPESLRMGGSGEKERQEKRLNEKQSWCAAKKNDLAELKRGVGGMKVHVLGTAPYTKAKLLSIDIKACELEITSIEGELRGFIEAKNDNWYFKWVDPNLWQAFSALLLMIAVPPILKVIFYYVLAPIASRRPPLVIVSEANGSEHSALKPEQASQIGAVSQSVVLTPNQELLVHSDYLQTTPLHAKKRTKWLLNNRLPLSSISSGMYMLTRLECSTQDPIVISSTNDHLSEVGIVELPEGAAFVCQPRSLVGVIYERDRPINISRHWRLGSLQSWLTLQLRFVVFHGPGRLLIKGSRGIRMESASAARLLNQSATLGFSANLKYANTRCETFVSYWAGKEGLFHDLFTGAPGVYVYEEVTAAKPGGLASLPQRFVDAVLNAFGI